MTSHMTAAKTMYAGLFAVSLATLMYEILLTRIFSVTMWYHFAFVAVSVAMFGMTVGALLVYLRPTVFIQERSKYFLALSSLLFAVSIPFSFLTHLSIPFVPDTSIVGLYSIGLTYAVIAVPFILSGICVCIALTHFPNHVSKLYAADLAGAAIGCILLIFILNATDAPTAVIVVAFCASAGSLLFAAESTSPRLTRVALVTSLLLALLALGHGALVLKESPLLRIVWFKGNAATAPPLYERWNSFSYVRVLGDPNKPSSPWGWGLSPLYPPDRQVHQLVMDIDASAGTFLTRFDGNMDDVEFLKYDITNLAHYLRPHSAVLVVGTGGGRDVLSALAFDQDAVTGVEINKNIIEAVNTRFGSFTGHLDRNPKVVFINDEARSYIARQSRRFDIIQVSLIDTWAATAAGAFVLTENSLYTVEAWKIFLEHLSPRGILTFSRWYFRDRPAEVYRLTSLAQASLKELGARNPRNHIIITTNLSRGRREAEPDGIGTMLLSKEPFSESDIDRIEAVTRQLQFTIVLSPRFSLNPTFATIASEKDLGGFYADFPLDISPPTDDNPFFFHMLRLTDAFNRELWKQGSQSFNLKAVFVLSALLVVVVLLTSLCIIVPLVLTTSNHSRLEKAWPYFMFFAAIGFGFMLVEMSQMQRLIIFLGHPTYGLSVVLFALLLSSGLGSYSTRNVEITGSTAPATCRLVVLLCVLGVFGAITPYVSRMFEGSTTMIRIVVATAILFPLGLFMGMPFPLGMKAAARRSTALTPWLWGINGATSVCASVLAVAIALNSSISVSFWAGFGCYFTALIALVWDSKDRRLASTRQAS